ncbi:MAG: extracellular solute-binding protein, partial [Oscillospiraceae bacterium]|nr:extracellular solute-binding protein [Oscillospiraceae bacterium]
VDLEKYPSGYPFVENKYAGKTLNIWTGETRNAASEPIIAEFEKGTGAKIEFTAVPYSDGLSAYATAIMAGTGIDFFAPDNRQFPTWIIKKLIVPVSTVLDLNDSLYQDSGLLVKGTSDFWTFKGEIYGFMPSKYTSCGYLVYNKALFDEAGLEDPYELWKEGKWDFDALEKAAAALTYDSDDDGIIDKFGLTGYLDSYWIGCAGGDANYVRWDENGNPQFALDDPDILECFVFERELRDKGYYHTEITPVADFCEQTAAIYGGIIEWNSQDFIDEIGIDNIGYVPFPASPSNTSGISNSLMHSSAYAIPSSVKEPELLKEWIDYKMFWVRADAETDEAAKLQKHIDTTYGGNEEWYNLNKTLLDHVWISNGASFGQLENICTQIYWSSSDTVYNLAQAVAPAAQAEIDEVFFDMTEE